MTSEMILATLISITTCMITYVPLVLTIFGLLGFFGNLFTYLQPELRSTTCCIYSLCGSLMDVCSLMLNLFTLFITSNYHVSLPWNFSSLACKLGMFIRILVSHLSINFLLMAIIDRFAATCSFTSPVRRILQLKMVSIMIILTIITSICCTFFVVIMFEIDVNFNSQCSSTNSWPLYILYMILLGFLQPILMFVFVLLTYRNLSQSRRRVNTVNEVHVYKHRAKFILMIFGQIFVSAFLTVQWIVLSMYISFASNSNITYEQIIIFYFLAVLSFNIYCLNNVKAFYISLLTSTLFRKIFIKSVIDLFPRRIRLQIRRLQANN